jgi:hypothetical protein
MWRGSIRLRLTGAAPFVWWCPNTFALNPFPHRAHRTGRADCQIGSRTRPYAFAHASLRLALSGVRYRSTHRDARVDMRAPASPDLRLVAQPPTQPRRRVAVERPIGAADGSHPEVVCPAPQHVIQLAHQLRGFLPCR